MFVFAIFGKRWHRVKAAFPPVTTFTIAMLLATFLHWDRFDIEHFPFQLWLILYIITPFLIPYLWLKNRVTDPGAPEPDDMKCLLCEVGLYDIRCGLASVWAVIMIIFPQFPILALETMSVDSSRLGRLVQSTWYRWTVCQSGSPLERLAYSASEHHLMGYADVDRSFPESAGFLWQHLESLHTWDGFSILMMLAFQVWMGVRRKQSA